MMTRLCRMIVWLGTAAAASSSFASTVASYESNQHGVVLRRQLNEIITAATCAKMGTVDAYPARLDLVYVYALEFYDPLDDLLYGVERAIATSVASTLTTCTAAEGASTTQSSMPMFAVELSDFSAHRVIDSSTTSTGRSSLCIDSSQNRSSVTIDFDTKEQQHCRLVRGVTSIRLGRGGTNTTGMDAKIFTLIAATLQDTLFLEQYSSTNLIRARFDRSIGGNLVLEAVDDRSDKQANRDGSDDEDGSDASGRTVLVALLMFVVVFAICVLGMYHHHHVHGDAATSQMIKDRRARIQAKRRQYFQNLDEDPSVSSGWMVTDAPPVLNTHPHHTTTWSDLTSDSESIISVLPLDRIEEEVNDDSEDGADCGEEVEVSMSGTVSTSTTLPSAPDVPDNRTPINMDHLTFIAHWNVASSGDDVVGDLQDVSTVVDEECGATVGLVDSLPRPDVEAIELDAGGAPFWLEEEETPVRSNRVSIEDSDVAIQASVSSQSQLLHGCEFVFEHDEPIGWMQGTTTGDDSYNSSSLEMSSDDDTMTPDTELHHLPIGAFKKDPLGDRTNASNGSSLSEIDPKNHVEPSSSSEDAQLADWARGVLDKLTTGSVQLLTCGTESEKVLK